MSLLLISATNRNNSASLKFAYHLSELLDRKHVVHSLISLDQFDKLEYSFADQTIETNQLTKFQDEVLIPCNKIIFIIPEYNGSFPGVLKWWIDTLSIRNAKDSFANKKTGLIGISEGKYGNIRGLEHFMSVCRYLKMLVYPTFVYIPNIESELNEWSPDSKYFSRIQKFTDEFLLF